MNSVSTLKSYVNTLFNIECVEGMKKYLPDDCIDSIVTDPPYGLKFMSKKWDYDVPSIETWKEIYRVLKPGGHVLSFFGTRTYHRGVTNIEEAGFEIRDQIGWVYGSGFPKSLDIGKAIDALQGNEREIIGMSDRGSGAQPNKLNNHEKGDTGIGYADGSGKKFIVTKGDSEFEGWGTALKPAWESIVLARKPLSEKTVAENVLRWGTGGININGCRVGSELVTTNAYKSKGKEGCISLPGEASQAGNEYKQSVHSSRFPANLIHDGSEEVINKFPMTTSGKPIGIRKAKNNIYGQYKSGLPLNGFGDSGSASRFFYCAKASKSERGEGNNHPTVKPLALMRYLCRLITPPDGIVLDPFTGSGTTLLAANLEGFYFCGFELNSEYCKIASKRMSEYREEND